MHRKYTGFEVSLSTGMCTYDACMSFSIVYADETQENVAADAYVIEGALTTFFRVAPGRLPRLDSWATRCLSVRTDRVVAIRLCE